jgi:hypothetical protein
MAPMTERDTSEPQRFARLRKQGNSAMFRNKAEEYHSVETQRNSTIVPNLTNCG